MPSQILYEHVFVLQNYRSYISLHNANTTNAYQFHIHISPLDVTTDV